MSVVIFGHTSALAKGIDQQITRFCKLLDARDYMFLSIYDLASELTGYKADAVINCSAMTGLDKCFHNAKAARVINTEWPKKLAHVCNQAKIPLLHFSTEAVFACDKPGKIYAESDTPDPETFYGVIKISGEPKAPCYVVRLPLLYGPTNSNQIVAKLIRKVLAGEDIQVATDIYTTPMYTPDVAAYAARWLYEISPRNLVHLGSDRLISLYDFITEITRRIKCSKGSVFKALSTDFPSAEPKPLHGGLRSEYIPAFSLDAGIMKYAEWINKNIEQFQEAA